MKLKQNLKYIFEYILDLLFPISCLVCGADQTFLCDKCFAELPRLENQLCLGCEKPAPFGKTHPDCVTKNIVDGVISALPYRDRSVKKIIETFKYNFVSDLKEPLGRLMLAAIRQQNLTEYFQGFTIIPVPLHSRRQNWRGFNQAQLLSGQLAENLRIPVNETLITRYKFTQPQTRLTYDQRRQNIQNAFTLSGPVAGKKFLLVDDVVTTGSTLNEMAKLLKHAQASEVWAITCAHG